jgi:hypothetical protein
LLGIILLRSPAPCFAQLVSSGPETSLAAGSNSGEVGEGQGSPTAHLINDVPAYIWYNGCGPTSLGMIIGYWDAHGYDNLIPGGNNWATNQTAIQNVIASPGSVRDYSPTPDRVATVADPYHTDDSLADFTDCSRDQLGFGSSYLGMQSSALTNYMAYCGYDGARTGFSSYNSIWYMLTTQIDKGDPVQIMVDSNADGTVDHFITGIGYDYVDGVKEFACYNTWDYNIHWYELAPVGVGVPFGAYAVTYMTPPPVPEPTLLMPLALLVGLWRRNRQHYPIAQGNALGIGP